MADQAILEKRLAEAEEARHQVITFQQAVEVRFADHNVRMIDQSSIAQLDSYIAELKRQLGQDVRVRRPIRPVFGS